MICFASGAKSRGDWVTVGHQNVLIWSLKVRWVRDRRRLDWTIKGKWGFVGFVTKKFDIPRFCYSNLG